MNTLHPAASLLFLASLAVLLVAPLVAWSLVGDRANTSARWWFGGCLMYALAAMVFVLRQLLPDAATAMLSVAFVIGCLLMLGESMRRELGEPPGLPRVAVAALAWLGCTTLNALGLRERIGLDLELLTYTLLEVSLLWQIRKLRRRIASRGLLVVGAGFFLVISLNLTRIVVSQSTGQPVTLLAYTPLSNAAYLANFLTIVMASFGFLGYLLEKSKQRELEEADARARAETLQAAERQRADELAEVLRQRDEMLLLNSRFSALSSMALFNSSIVHEVSQPLQALSAVIDGYEVDLEREGVELPPAIGHAKGQLQRMSAVLASLRNLVAAQTPKVERMNWQLTTQEVMPILQSEARSRGIGLSLTESGRAADSHVDASRVMLQRVVFNLVTNAFEALSKADRPRHDSPEVVIELDIRRLHGADHAVLRVKDNGPGLPQEMLGRHFEPFRTGREGGTGLGLALARAVLENWGGYIEASNLEPTGACVELGLPVQPAD